jgi:predicted amidohydrolase
VEANVREHLHFIAAAREREVGLLVFPELSLSGYELPLLQQCVLSPQDARLSPLRQAAQRAGMTVVVGAPVSQAGALAPAIGAITFWPDGAVSLYCKQFLHPGEEAFASPGLSANSVHTIADAHFALAICADTCHPQHAQQARDSGASLYLASVLVSERGHAVDAAQLQRYAAQHGLEVLMANHGAPSGGFLSAGRSAFWSAGGHLVAAAPGSGRYLVRVQRGVAGWTGSTVPLAFDGM